MAQYVKLGPKASFFRAASIDLSIAPGEVKAINAKQMNNRAVKKALNGGHLVITTKEDKDQKTLSIEEIRDSFVQMVKENEDHKKISKTFSMDELKDIASTYGIEVEPEDKKIDIVEAIIAEFGEN